MEATKHMRKLSILAAALLLAPAISQAKTLDELLVEKGVITKGEAAGMGGGASKLYYNGGTRAEFPDSGFTFGINTLIQERYEFTDYDAGSNSSSFTTPNARIVVSGSALNNEFSYYLNTNFVGSSDANGAASPELLDSYITWHACDWAWAMMGQFKTMLGRQYNTSDAKKQFADDSIVTDLYNWGRNQGLVVGGGQDGFSWAAAVVNGISAGEGQNLPGVDTKHAYNVALRYNLGDIDAMTEGDVDGTKDHAASVGFAWGHSKSEAAGSEETINTYNVDLTYKYEGFSVAGEYFHRKLDTADISDNGYYVQAGYFVMPSELELAARYGLISYDNNDSNGIDKNSEISIGANYFWWKHQLKAQAGWTRLTTEPVSGSNTHDNKWTFQLSSWF